MRRSPLWRCFRRDLVRREAWPSGGGPVRYYGSADSTSWFLVVLASLDDPQLAAELEGHGGRRVGGSRVRWERGSGLVRHGPRDAPGGLVQQGWRDTVDPADPAFNGGGIVRPDGAAPRAPLADSDTQTVTVVALRALARLSGEESWWERSPALASRVDEELGQETIALEADGSAVAGAGSHLGWLLWADALSPPARDRAAERLSRPGVLTPWGLRTLSVDHPQFAPDAYHRGSVWPFDSWLWWGGTSGRWPGRRRGAPPQGRPRGPGVAGAGPGAVRGWPGRPPSRSRSPTASRRGPWALAGPSNTSGTVARRGSSTEAGRGPSLTIRFRCPVRPRRVQPAPPRAERAHRSRRGRVLTVLRSTQGLPSPRRAVTT